MRMTVGRVGLLVMGAWAGAASAQSPSRPPVFAPDDREGLVISPNPGNRYAFKRPVHWKWAMETVAERGVPPATAAERAAVGSTLEAVSAMLRATPEGTSGQGFWVNEDRRIHTVAPYELPPDAPLARWPLLPQIGFFPFYHEDVLRNGTWRLSVAGETESAYFYLNWHPQAVEQPVIARENRGEDRAPTTFYLRPRETGRFGGMVVYDAAVLVAARAGRDLWTPVPLARMLRATLPSLQEDVKAAERRLDGYRQRNAEVQAPAWEAQQRADFEKNNGALRTTRPGNYALRLQNMERYITLTRTDAAAAANPQRDAAGLWYWNPVDALAETMQRLQSLSMKEGARPSCYVEYTTSPARDGRYALRGRIDVDGASPDCRPLVMTNWAYFDLTLPRSATQLLVLRDFGRCARLENGRLVPQSIYEGGIDAPVQGCPRHLRMWRDADWSRLTALVVP